MELDFDENNDDEGPDESEGTENTPCAQDERVLRQNENHRRKGVVRNNVTDENFSANEIPISGEVRDCSEQLEPTEVSAAPPRASPQLKSHRVRDVSGLTVNHDSSKTPNSLSDILWHLSDLSVKPVMPSRKSDKEAVPSLSFEAPQPSDFGKMRKQELEPLNNRIITVLSGNSAGLSEKQNLIRYLETLSSNADTANILTNGPITLVLVKALRLSKTPAFGAQIASLTGLLIWHSTSIEDDLANSGILDSLTNGLRDKHEKVRRYSKITPILETWRRRKTTEVHLLVLKRILHCLGYAFKQYLSQAMMLSISGQDVSKINAIVSEIKNSDSIASLVAMELQRLPR